jgi:hypothetical protein
MDGTGERQDLLPVLTWIQISSASLYLYYNNGTPTSTNVLLLLLLFFLPMQLVILLPRCGDVQLAHADKMTLGLPVRLSIRKK